MRLQFEDIDDCAYCDVAPSQFREIPHWDLGFDYVPAKVDICDYHRNLSHAKFVGKILAQRLAGELEK